MNDTLSKRLKSLQGAAKQLRAADTATKNKVLLEIEKLLKTRQSEILAANAKDLKALKKAAPSAFVDRLRLDIGRIDSMIGGLQQVTALQDPVGEVTESKVLKNGLNLRRVRSPLGVIFMIFESRPNVVIEAFSLAFKAGNVIILRGGKESMGTAKILYSILEEALKNAGLSKNCLWGITSPDRAITGFLLKQKNAIDVVVPRGGEGLINFVVANSKIPIIKHDRGMCHVYVHEDADLAMATQIVVNSKAQRPGVCNAMETLLVHKNIATDFIPRLYDALAPYEVKWHADKTSQSILKGRSDVYAAKPKDWDTEYLDYVMNCRVVPSLDEAIEHIEVHGSKHSEAIVTSSEKSARHFQGDVDAAAVLWNASTRFDDGFEFGLGGELGISTQKLHVRGPVGLKELTSVRWVVDGTGQIR